MSHATTTCYCIYCASPVLGDGKGPVTCGQCGRAFEYLAVESAPPLSYSTPATEKETPSPTDPYCRKGLIWSFFSPLCPAISVYAFGLGAAGYVRVRESQSPGKGLAVLAMILSGVGLLVFCFLVFIILRSNAFSVMCMSNMRQLSSGVSLYEQAFPNATGYSVDDVASFNAWPRPLRCPNDPVTSPAAVPRPSSSYILLTYLQPFSKLPRPSTTPIAFELVGHERSAGANINVAFADGHIEVLPLPDALAAIQSAANVPASQPATAPAGD